MTSMPLSFPCPTLHRMFVSGDDNWRRDRLAEARSVLADVTHHPDALIILAAHVVSRHTDDPAEGQDASDLCRLLDRRPFKPATTANLPLGGVA